MNRRGGTLRLALPSDRMMEDDTLAFMEKCGLAVRRASSRQYVGRIASVPDIEVLFQRSVDIPREVDAGDVDMAIIGYERYLEDRDEDGDSIVVLETLGYSHTDLVVAAPNSWADVRTMADLAAHAERNATGAPLRVATKYHRQVGRFLDRHAVTPPTGAHQRGHRGGPDDRHGGRGERFGVERGDAAGEQPAPPRRRRHH